MAIRIRDEGRGNRVEGDAAGADVELVIDGDENEVSIASGVRFGKESSWRIEGHRNSFSVGSRSRFRNVTSLTVQGDDNTVVFGKRCWGRVRLHVETSGALFQMGDDTTVVGGNFTLQEPHRLVIGEDCMFSAGVWVGVSDMHAIFDMDTGEQINRGGDVIIGDHVWVGLQAKVTKNVTIGSGSVIGTASVVTSDVPENCSAAGVPARVVRERISWTRELEGKTPLGKRSPME